MLDHLVLEWLDNGLPVNPGSIPGAVVRSRALVSLFICPRTVAAYVPGFRAGVTLRGSTSMSPLRCAIADAAAG
jgi:hypothetical protein